MKFLFTFIITLISSLTFAQKNSILWQAEKEDVKIYLLGANHLYPADSISNKEKINALIKNSDLFIGELDRSNDNRDSIFNSRKDNQIEKHLGKKDFKIYENLFPEDKYIFKHTPAEVNIKLERKNTSISCGFNNKETMDSYFENQIKQANIPISNFENVIDQLKQMNNFYNYSDEVLWGINRKMIKKIEKIKTRECNGISINKNNYVFDFEKEIPEKQKPFWDERNLKWISILDDILAKNQYKTIFIKVGIGHLDYSNGLIKLLQNKNFQLTPIIF